MMPNIKNLFTKSRKDRILTIEASKYENEDSYVLPNHPGMYTIKNINDLKTSDDIFYFIDGKNVLPGYIETSNANSINLIDGKNKLISSICNSFYHSILDDMSELLHAIKTYPDYDIIIDVSEIAYGLETDKTWDVFNFFVNCLRKENKKVTLIELKKYEIIYIDNFRRVSFMYESGKKSNLIHELFKKYTTNPNISPTKNVFVSRKFAIRESKPVEGLSYSNDNRMDDHVALEDYFASMGYEIIHAEFFQSFQEQLDYFYSAKTIVSITGSGLTNAAFMQPGGTMVEIVTPLVVSVPPPDRPKDITNPFYVQEIHNFYKNLAYYQEHLFVAIQNPRRSFEEFKQVVESNPRMKAFLNRND